MRGDERAHDGQAEPAAARGARPGLIRAVEPLEHALGLFRGHAGPVVGHVERDHARAESGARGSSIPDPIDTSIGDPSGVWVSALLIRFPMTCRSRASSPIDEERGAGLDRQVDGPGRGEQPGVVHRVGGQREQVDRLPGQRPLLVEPGQQQQVLDEQAHPGRFLLYPLHDPVQVVRREPASYGPGVAARRIRRSRARRRLVPVRDQPAALAVVLGEAADRGQRRAQLVAGIGDETPHPFLRLVRRRLGFLPRMEGGLDLAQHDVQRPAEAAYLGARITLGYAPVQVPVRDLFRGLLDFDQRPQVRPHHREPDDQQHEQDRRRSRSHRAWSGTPWSGRGCRGSGPTTRVPDCLVTPPSVLYCTGWVIDTPAVAARLRRNGQRLPSSRSSQTGWRVRPGHGVAAEILPVADSGRPAARSRRAPPRRCCSGGTPLMTAPRKRGVVLHLSAQAAAAGRRPGSAGRPQHRRRRRNSSPPARRPPERGAP